MGVGGQRHATTALLPGKTQYTFYRRLDGSQGRSGDNRVLRREWVWSIDGTVPARENWGNWQNAFPVPLCPPHVALRPTWCRSRNAAMREACMWHHEQWHEVQYVSSYYVLCIRYVNTCQTSHPGSLWKGAGAKGDNHITCMCQLSWNLGAQPTGTLSRNCCTFYLHFYVFHIIFYRCRVHLDITKVCYLPTDAFYISHRKH
jgi:hypothetical protein